MGNLSSTASWCSCYGDDLWPSSVLLHAGHMNRAVPATDKQQSLSCSHRDGCLLKSRMEDTFSWSPRCQCCGSLLQAAGLSRQSVHKYWLKKYSKFCKTETAPVSDRLQMRNTILFSTLASFSGSSVTNLWYISKQRDDSFPAPLMMWCLRAGRGVPDGRRTVNTSAPASSSSCRTHHHLRLVCCW